MQAQKLEINTLSVSAKIKDYQLLLKPNLSGLVVFSSIISYLLAPNVVINLLDYLLWQKIGYLFLGGMLVTGAAKTINQILERQTDGLMNRTKDRPMPAGRMNNAEAWVLAFVA
ncbi:MAG: protoheme IX farnesyltransferase, partial [Chitinophagia bacterium]|nr:protoheme IX farnesyltransferase [Chitinophagia bacterium]